MPDGATRIAIPRWIQLVGLSLELVDRISFEIEAHPKSAGVARKKIEG